MVSSEYERERRDHSLRRTGIPPLGLIPWGAHICMFYEEPEDLIEAYADYFAAGLADNERCVWALSDPMDSERAVAHLRHAVVGFEDYLAAGAIELVPRRQWSLREDEFDSRRFTNGWLRKVDGTLAQGFAGLRIGGDAFWMQTHLWARFHEYEA